MVPLVLLLWTTNITFSFVGHLIFIFVGILKSTNSSILEHVHHCQTTKLCAHKINDFTALATFKLTIK